MNQANNERLAALSARIDREEHALAIKLMAESILGKGKSGGRDNMRQKLEEEKYASICLRSLRIHLYLELQQQRCVSYSQEIQADWKYIVDCLKFLECELDASKTLLSNAVDIILLPDLSKRIAFLKQLDFRTRIKIKPQYPLSQTVFSCAIHMAKYCLRQEMTEEACTINSNLVLLSERYNKSVPDRHRECVITALYFTVDVDNALTSAISHQQARYFAGIEDANTCRFLWFYGYSLLITGRDRESMPILKQCHELCLQVDGDSSWTGACAGMLYNFTLLDERYSEAAEAYLWDTLRKMDQAYYRNMDSTSAFFTAYTLSVLLGIHFERQNLKAFFPEIIRFRDYCYENEATSNTPRITVRYAENTLSAYYTETGDYLQAAEHALKALNAPPPEGMIPYPADVLLYSNLLLIYSILNDTDQIICYYNLLLDEWETYQDDDYVAARVHSMLSFAEKKLTMGDLRDDHVHLAREHVNQFYERIVNGTVGEDGSKATNRVVALWILDQVSSVITQDACDADELPRMQAILMYFLERPQVYPLSDPQKLAFYYTLSTVQWRMGSPDTEVSIQKVLRYLNCILSSSEARISTLCSVAFLYYQMGKAAACLPLVDEALDGITDAWHKATAYLNDQKVYQVLSLIQLSFINCYSILRKNRDSHALYEAILRFKDLPALVGRERNRLLRLTPVDEALRAEIFTLQDQLAAAELNDSLQGTDTAQAIAQQLQNREAAFAEQFPTNVAFTEISFQKVCQKLPEGAAIVEYYFSLGQLHQVGASEKVPVEADVFVLKKICGQVHFHHLTLENGNDILDKADTFIHILQDPQQIARAGEKHMLQSALYENLVVPVIPYLDDVATLYIAPDDHLCNLPFEILCHGSSGTLQDRFAICRLVCGRDILFYNDRPSHVGGHFILGDPNYEAEQGARSQSKGRGEESSLVPVDALPFSGVEAQRIARRCSVQPITGNRATKFALQEALPCGIIHIATHGVFDEETQMDSLYASHLVFAGYNKWVRQNTESSGCGNGILTADEISRMNLHDTELVVLSACQTGLGDISLRSTRGLISAFSAAGARWIVCHMWHASDFATPILMDAFYHAYLHLCMAVPEALQYAKNYLRNVTIGELRRDGWLDIPSDSSLLAEAQDEILALRTASDRRRPFADEFYWGGFTVHRSR